MKGRRIAVYATSLIAVCIVFIAGIVACELAFRALDGYKIWSLRLIRVAPEVQGEGTSARRYAHSIPLAEGMAQEWFDLSPPPLPRTPDSKLLAILAGATKALEASSILQAELFHVFNSEYLKRHLCSHPMLEPFPNFIFLYDPPGGREHPRYRFPLDTVTPGGLVTNQFGWRGPPIALRKPPNTIRIAFVGASTTVNSHSFPFSYPELAGFWLNKWAEETFGVRVEIINAGREGIISTDIAAVVRDEVLPLEPDLVVYYEGGNQFAPSSIVRLSGAPGPRPAMMAQGRKLPSLENHSAMARRIAELVTGLTEVGAEPAKPSYTVAWPTDVDEDNPPLDHPALPSNLSTILRDLDDIRASVADSGGELAIGSFFWLVFEGMKLDPVRHSFQLNYLNVVWHPYRYREMERLAAFQNRTLRKFAGARGLPYLDIAESMPRDPDLFQDAVHATYEGIRLFGWIAAQKLAPLLRDRIERKSLPRPFRSGLVSHPGFPANERTAVFACRPDVREVVQNVRLDLSQPVRVVKPARVAVGAPLKVDIPASMPPHSYAALIESPWVEQPKRKGPYLFRARVKVSGGQAGIGVLSADEKKWRSHQPLKESAEFVPVQLAFEAEDIGPIVITNGEKAGVSDRTVEVSEAELVAYEGSRVQLRNYSPGLALPPALP